MLKFTGFTSTSICICAGLDYMRPEYERLQEVDTVQCIWQQPTPHSRDFEDSSLMNHQLGASMQAMYQQRLFTDATILVEGQILHAHRAVLAVASPVFERMFSSHMQEGRMMVRCLSYYTALLCTMPERFCHLLV